MVIRDLLSVPLFLILLFLTYGSMWMYIGRNTINKRK